MLGLKCYLVMIALGHDIPQDRLVKTCGVMARPKGREVNWNTQEVWRNHRYFIEVGRIGM